MSEVLQRQLPQIAGQSAVTGVAGALPSHAVLHPAVQKKADEINIMSPESVDGGRMGAMFTYSQLEAPEVSLLALCQTSLLTA